MHHLNCLNLKKWIYWNELKQIMEWSKHNVKTTLHICWGAQAGLYYHYGIEKKLLKEKEFGVFSHKINDTQNLLLKGLEQNFMAPHSRHTTVNTEKLEKDDNLIITSFSDEAGVFSVENRQGNQIFIMGHLEYDLYTLDKEYKRDKLKGLDIKEPKNYYKDGQPVDMWSKNGDILYSNWINYYTI